MVVMRYTASASRYGDVGDAMKYLAKEVEGRSAVWSVAIFLDRVLPGCRAVQNLSCLGLPAAVADTTASEARSYVCCQLARLHWGEVLCRRCRAVTVLRSRSAAHTARHRNTEGASAAGASQPPRHRVRPARCYGIQRLRARSGQVPSNPPTVLGPLNQIDEYPSHLFPRHISTIFSQLTTPF